MTAAEVARRARMTHPAASSILRSLVHQGLVESSPAGRGFTYWILRDNAYVEEFLNPVFSAERHIPDMMLEELRRELEPLTVSTVLFGSYARGDQSAESDLDIVVVADNESAKEVLESALSDYAQTFERRFGARLSPLIYDRREAAELSSRSASLWESIRRQSLTVCGLSASEWGDDGWG